MSARDDYPLLAALANATIREPEYERALDEIDRLRLLAGEAIGDYPPDFSSVGPPPYNPLEPNVGHGPGWKDDTP